MLRINKNKSLKNIILVLIIIFFIIVLFLFIFLVLLYNTKKNNSENTLNSLSPTNYFLDVLGLDKNLSAAIFVCNCPRDLVCEDKVKNKCGEKPSFDPSKCKMTNWVTAGDEKSGFDIKSKSGYACLEIAKLIYYYRCKYFVELVGDKVDVPFNGFILTPKYTFLIEVPGASNNISGSFIPGAREVYIQGENLNNLTESSLPHEIMHLVIGELNKDVKNERFSSNTPIIFDEGLAKESESQKNKCDSLKRLLDALKNNNEFPIENLLSTSLFDPNLPNKREINLAYAQAYSLADFLINKNGGGCKGKGVLIQQMIEGNPKLPSNYGFESFDEMKTGWLNDLKRQYGNDTYRDRNYDIMKNCNICTCT